MSKALFKKGISILLSALISLSATLGYITTPAFAANEETINALFFSHPRDGDENAFTGNWGHPDHNYMGGWSSKAGTQFNFYIKSYAEPLVSYCIEPGVNLAFGESLKGYGDTFWKNYPDKFNLSIMPDDIKLHIGRILQYGFAEEADVENWRTQTDAAKMSEAIATQLLIWETVVGERDENFNKVSLTNGNVSPVELYKL